MVGRNKRRTLLSKKELELVTDWLAVRGGKLSPDDFLATLISGLRNLRAATSLRI